MADTSIKPDPEAQGASPGTFASGEDDVYEDAGDLEFNTNPEFQKMYMARVPKFLWEAWSKLDDDAEIQIGTVRQQNITLPNGQVQTKLSMLLSNQIAQHQTIPKEYELEVTEQSVKNTFVFSEQDIPGFKSRSRQKFDLETANMPARLTRPKNENPMARQPYDPNRRFQPYFRKAVPKRTVLQGKIAHELNCVAVENEESIRLLSQRTLDAMKPKVHTKFINEDLSTIGKGFIQPGAINAQNTFSKFIKTAAPSSGSRPQTQKTARMPQNELYDKIFACFRRFNYWSMKAFKAELQQPETYLRETLENIAVLAKSGRFAAHWSLKPENRMQGYEGSQDAAAPALEGTGEDSDMADEEDGEDDEDVKFEDV